MKAMHLPGLAKASILGFFVISAGNGFAQSTGPGPDPTTSIPVVTIRATRTGATWSGSPGVFTAYRAGDLAPSLNVYYRILGTASNGWDYQTIGNFVYIPSGAYSNDVIIKPINRGQTSCLSVDLLLSPSPTLNPVNYAIGYPSNAVLSICPGTATDMPPVARMIYPTNGAVFYTPTDLPLVAGAYDPDGFIRKVEFYANSVKLGEVTNPVSVLPPTPTPMPPPPPMPPFRPYVLIWSNAPAGTNIQIYAKATDNAGLSSSSPIIGVTIRPG